MRDLLRTILPPQALDTAKVLVLQVNESAWSNNAFIQTQNIHAHRQGTATGTTHEGRFVGHIHHRSGWRWFHNI